MKQGWTYKKLWEVCDIINGKNQRAVENPNGPYPIMGSGGVMGYADDYLCNEGSTIIGRKGTINRPIYVEQKFWNVDTAFGLQPKDDTNSRFLFYLCKSINFERYNKSVTIPSLVKSDLLKIDVSVPQADEQQQIVSELDLLIGVIEKQKAQIEELDKLTQSIFYDMFGDPVTNEKGWDINLLSKVCLSITDGDHMPPPKSESGIPFITISDIDKQSREIVFGDTFFVSQEYYDSLKDDRKAKLGDVLYTVTGSYGIPVMIKSDKVFCFQRHVALLKPDSNFLNSYFLNHWVLCDSVKHMADDVATGIAQKTVGLNSLRKFPIILPPLSFQQEFAAKVEAIEQMKAKVCQSLKEVETLFNSRMDYYFN